MVAGVHCWNMSKLLSRADMVMISAQQVIAHWRAEDKKGVSLPSGLENTTSGIEKNTHQDRPQPPKLIFTVRVVFIVELWAAIYWQIRCAHFLPPIMLNNCPAI